MAAIKANGQVFGIDVIVHCSLEKGIPKIQINGELSPDLIKLLLNQFDVALKNPPALGGTFYPPENSMMAAFSILQSGFFDRGTLKELTVDGDIGQVPMDDPDIIY